jgi:hypothetical protein
LVDSRRKLFSVCLNDLINGGYWIWLEDIGSSHDFKLNGGRSNNKLVEEVGDGGSWRKAS